MAHFIHQLSKAPNKKKKSLFTSNSNWPGRGKKGGGAKWNIQAQKADSPPSNPSLIPPNPPLPHTRTGSLPRESWWQGKWRLSIHSHGPLAKGMPYEHFKQTRPLQVLIIIKYTYAVQEPYFKVRLSSGGGGETQQSLPCWKAGSPDMHIPTHVWKKSI